MQRGIIFDSNGFRDGSAAIQKFENGVLIGQYATVYRLVPNGERTKPEDFVVCDVYSDPLCAEDDGRVLWQVAVSEQHLEHLSV